MKIAVDLDNTLVWIMQSARLAVAADIGVHYDEIVETGIYHETFTHRDPDMAARIVLGHEFWARDAILRDAPPYPDAVRSMRRLQEAGVLGSYITRREPGSETLTRDWLSRHGFPDVPLHLVGTADPATAYATCKSEACRRDGSTVLIDDSVDEARTAAAAGIRVVMVDPHVGREARRLFIEQNPGIEIRPGISEAVDFLLETR